MSRRIDPVETLGGTRRYNLHSHTQFCDGRAPMEAFAREAVARDFDVYAFTPHSPLPIESPCNMKQADVPLFLEEVERIRREYGSHCRFLAGMEIDYLSPVWGPSIDYFRDLPLDFAIGSVHFIPTQSGEFVDIDGRFEDFSRRMKACFRGDIDYVVNTFFDSSEAMLRAGGFEIMGHPDKVAQNATYYCPGLEDSEMYRSRMNRLLDLIVESGVAVEINTKARTEHRRIFPAERHLPRLVASGVRLVVNSDAHYPERIDASRAYGFELIDALNALKA